MAAFSNRLFALALTLVAGLAACAPDDPSVDPAASSTVLPAARTPMPDALEPALLVLSEFEGYYDGTTGEFVIEPVYATAEQLEGEGALRTVNQPLYCRRQAANDGNPDTNPPNTVEVYTVPGTINSSIAGTIPANPFCVTNGGPNSTAFGILGVFCATVRVSNYYAEPLTEVYAVVQLLAGGEAFGPYVGALGNGILTPAGITPETLNLTSIDAVWAYGDLAASGQSGFQEPVTWSFRYPDATGSFRFIGRIVSRGPAEVCGNTDDEDCDGRLNNGCSAYGVGDACLANNDCTTGFCEAGFCAGNPCTDLVQNGAETDVDCGGPLCGQTCDVGDDCNSAADCASGFCRGPSGAQTCRAYSQPLPGEIVITEFMAAPSNNDAEWFEIYNRTGGPLDLEGCVLNDRSNAGNNNDFTLPAITVPPGYFLLVEPGAEGNATAGLPADRWARFTNGTSWGLAAGSADIEYIHITCNGDTIDRVDYNNAVLNLTPTARSTQLDVAAVLVGSEGYYSRFCNTPVDAANVYATISSVSQYGTPGRENLGCASNAVSWCELDLPVTNPVLAPSNGFAAFSGRFTVDTVTNRTAGNDYDYRVVAEIRHALGGTNPFGAGWQKFPMSPFAGWFDPSLAADVDRYQATVSVPFPQGTTLDVAMRVSGDGGFSWQLCDLSGDGFSLPATVLVGPPEPPAAAPTAPGDVVITEVMINGTGGGSPEVTEYIELHNRSATTFDLAGCKIGETLSSPQTHTIAWSGSSLLLPGAYTVIGVRPFSTNGGIAVAGTVTGLAINNGGETISLLCGAGDTEIDRVQFLGDEDADGVSVQLDPSRLAATSGNDARTGGSPNLLQWWCLAPRRAETQQINSIGPTFGTPGGPNLPCLPNPVCQLTTTTLAAVPVGSAQQVSVTFNSPGVTNVTTAVNTHHMLRVQASSGAVGSAPSTWSWPAEGTADARIATPTTGWSDPAVDSYTATITAPATADAEAEFAFRVSTDNGTTWLYCDAPPGSADGYQSSQGGRISTPASITVASCELISPLPNISAQQGSTFAGDQRNIVGGVIAPGATDNDALLGMTGIEVQFGYGPTTTAPGANGAGWTNWFNAGLAGGTGSNYDFFGYALTVPAEVGGSNRYAMRAKGPGDADWILCDNLGNIDLSTLNATSVLDTTGAGTLARINGAIGTVTGRSSHGFSSPPGLPAPSVIAEYGIGPAGTTPIAQPAQWPVQQWFDGSYAGVIGNDWTWTTTYTVPGTLAAGNYIGVWRVSGDGGATWVYGDLNSTATGGGFDSNKAYTISEPTVGSLVITEVLANPTCSNDDCEWIEIYNPNAYALRLNGFLEGLQTSSVQWSIPAGSNVVINAGAYAVIGKQINALRWAGATPSTGQPDVDFVASALVLPNSNATNQNMALRYSGVVVSSMTYPAPPSGFAYSLTNTSANPANSANWCNATTAWVTGGDRGTPGAANPACVVSIAPGSLIVTEVFYGGSGGGSVEWIEVYNTTASPIDIGTTTGLQIFDDTQLRATVTTGVVPEGGYAAFGNIAGGCAGMTACWTPDGNFLGGGVTGDSVIIKDALSGTTIDTVNYGTNNSGIGLSNKAGRSIQLNVDFLASSAAVLANGLNWCRGIAIYAGSDYGTPGTANHTCAVTCSAGVDADDDDRLDCTEAACSGAPGCAPPAGSWQDLAIMCFDDTWTSAPSYSVTNLGTMTMVRGGSGGNIIATTSNTAVTTYCATAGRAAEMQTWNKNASGSDEPASPARFTRFTSNLVAGTYRVTFSAARTNAGPGRLSVRSVSGAMASYSAGTLLGQNLAVPQSVLEYGPYEFTVAADGQHSIAIVGWCGAADSQSCNGVLRVDAFRIERFVP